MSRLPLFASKVRSAASGGSRPTPVTGMLPKMQKGGNIKFEIEMSDESRDPAGVVVVGKENEAGVLNADEGRHE